MGESTVSSTNNFSIDAITLLNFIEKDGRLQFTARDKAAPAYPDLLHCDPHAIYMQICIANYDYLLLIIAQKHYGLSPSLHTGSNSIGQILFKRGVI